MNRYLSDSANQPNHSENFFPESPIWRTAIIAVLLLVALGIRLIGINAPPLDIHPVKQYGSALTARLYYYEATPTTPTWKIEMARKNVQLLGSLGPTVIERLAVFAYRLAGGERLWIPRLMSALFWVIGAVFLFLLTLELTSYDAAAITTAFYLFLPATTLISQSFQPDPLMVMLMIISLFVLVEHQQHPTTGKLLLAALLASVAILVKPVSLFFVFGAFIPLLVYQYGIYKLVLHPRFWLFTIGSLLPTALFYGYNLFISQALQGQADTSFIPSLLLELYFWQFWLKHIYGIIGFAAFLGGMVGVLLFAPDWRRLMMIGLWVGYLIYGLVFNYHIHTHDYYQLPFVPVVALSLGPLGALLLKNFNELHTHWLPRAFMAAILLLATLLHIGLFLRERQEMPDLAAEVRLAEEIGARVNHSTHTLILAPYSGSPLKYHGEIAGWPWPTVGDINAERLIGMPELSVEARFDALQVIHEPDYFIVTDFAEYMAQEDLRTFLTTHFPIILQGENYLIFSLSGGE